MTQAGKGNGLETRFGITIPEIRIVNRNSSFNMIFFLFSSLGERNVGFRLRYNGVLKEKRNIRHLMIHLN